jgi:hypothetical protein
MSNALIPAIMPGSTSQNLARSLGLVKVQNGQPTVCTDITRPPYPARLSTELLHQAKTGAQTCTSRLSGTIPRRPSPPPAAIGVLLERAGGA